MDRYPVYAGGKKIVASVSEFCLSQDYDDYADLFFKDFLILTFDDRLEIGGCLQQAAAIPGKHLAVYQLYMRIR